jgi:hypothetical protein
MFLAEAVATFAKGTQVKNFPPLPLGHFLYVLSSIALRERDGVRAFGFNPIPY